MSEMISEKDAAELKTRHRLNPERALPPNQHWYSLNFASVQAALGTVSRRSHYDCSK